MPTGKGGSGQSRTNSSGGGKYGAMRHSTSTTAFGMTECGTVALEAIDQVIDDGDAIILSRTSDGGAIAVTILTGNERVKEYASSQVELDRIVDFLKKQ